MKYENHIMKELCILLQMCDYRISNSELRHDTLAAQIRREWKREPFRRPPPVGSVVERVLPWLLLLC